MRLLETDWPKTTERLTIRPLRTGDAEAIWAYRSQEEVSRWITRAELDRDEFVAALETPERRASTLVIERDSRVIGDLMLRIDDAWAQAEVADRAAGVQAELGWVLDPGFGGNGYATEAVRELIRICFQDLGLRRVVADCFAANEASWRLMERLGMRREQHSIRESLHRDLGWLDAYGYALLADEWDSTARP